jgi:hypothetical protein
MTCHVLVLTSSFPRGLSPTADGLLLAALRSLIVSDHFFLILIPSSRSRSRPLSLSLYLSISNARGIRGYIEVPGDRDSLASNTNRDFSKVSPSPQLPSALKSTLYH